MSASSKENLLEIAQNFVVSLDHLCSNTCVSALSIRIYIPLQLCHDLRFLYKQNAVVREGYWIFTSREIIPVRRRCCSPRS